MIKRQGHAVRLLDITNVWEARGSTSKVVKIRNWSRLVVTLIERFQKYRVTYH